MRYDLISPRPKKDGGTFWHRVGTAFPRDNGGFSLIFDSLPLPDKDGRTVVLMAEQKDREAPRQEPAKRSGGYGEVDDEIPF